MTVIVTRDVPDRFRGFLGSCMLEVAPGVYTQPRMNPRVRQRVWEVMEEWHRALGEGSVVMTWPDTTSPGGQVVRTLGWPAVVLVEVQGLHLVARPPLPSTGG